MVASLDEDSYLPFQHPMLTEEGIQSSEEGSGLHSPIFGAQFPVNGDFRYHNPDIALRHASGLLATVPQYLGYGPSMQQGPLIKLEAPFHSDFSISPTESPVNTILPLSAQGGAPLDFRFDPPSFERRLPGGPSYDHSYGRQSGHITGIAMASDSRSAPSSNNSIRPETSTNIRSDPSRESRLSISTAVIACRQCRGRKIKCDSTRPFCQNCLRRSNQCEYDIAPKRRGPDKRPGTRQRSCKKRPTDGSAPPPAKRKRISERTSTARQSIPSESQDEMVESKRLSVSAKEITSVPIHGSPSVAPNLRIETNQPLYTKVDRASTSPLQPYPYDPASYPRPSYLRNMGSSTHRVQHPHFPPPPAAFESELKNWWDEFLSIYPIEDILAQLSYLLSDAGHWLSFLNFPLLKNNLSNPHERVKIQPSFILAGLAMSILMRSSELENGEEGRNRAIWLRDAAADQMERSWNVEWIDAPLAEAALIIALFESSAHPLYTPDRAASSLKTLDDIIRRLSLTSLDVNDVDVPTFPLLGVPVVKIPFDDLPERKCCCEPQDSIRSHDPSRSWTYVLPWDEKWSRLEIRDEECRRVCWTSLGLIANYTVQCAAFDRAPPDLFLTDPSNYTLLFPAEALDRNSPVYRSVDSPSTKDSIWALYCRSMLLWCFCNGYRYDPNCSDENKAELSAESWNETQALLDALNLHVCNLDTPIMYLTREYISNTRMAITHALRSLQGLDRGGFTFSRKQAEEWIYYQDQVVKRARHSLLEISGEPGKVLTRRPYQVSWYSNQLALCIMLWNNDRSLMNALELGKSLLVPVDALNVLWPCSYYQHQCVNFRIQLSEACHAMGFDLPPQPNYSLPPELRTA
ncbi:hypothetical protein C8J56DRAFT_918462 [Mycena floridula]|nr:hypothetical protein C8J56DRAFT_918462 [Mycena floridula]